MKDGKAGRMTPEQLEEAKNAVEQAIKDLNEATGGMAELALMFYRAAIGAGANGYEALKLTQAYISALFFGKGMTGQKKEERPE